MTHPTPAAATDGWGTPINEVEPMTEGEFRVFAADMKAWRADRGRMQAEIAALRAERDALRLDREVVLDAVDSVFHQMREPMTLEDAREAKHSLTLWHNERMKAAVLARRALSPEREEGK